MTRHAPRRLWLMGHSGAGKSTLSSALARSLGVEPVHLDDLHWLPAWRERDRAEMTAMLAARLDAPRWVVDGNYESLRRIHREAADLLVWVDPPLPRVLWRLLRRTVRRSLRGESCCNGNRETLRKAFASRDSVVLYMLRTWTRRRREMVRELRRGRVFRLRTARDRLRLLRAVGGRA